MWARKKLGYGRPPWIRHTLSRPGPRFVSRGSSFGVLSSPWCYLQSEYLGRNDSLSALGGKLCYIHSTSPWDNSIWLAEDGSNLAWSLCRRVCLPIPRMLLAFACASTDRDKIFISVDACILLRCDLRDGSLEEIINMPRDMLYDLRNGRKINIGALFVAHYMVPYVESLLRIRPSR
uniref:F-box associated domain-containing protein n=1 Tax=Aegilops tauschii subsp. strangulata TaxID=200361 RepID=A0A453TEE7_AEGTS